MTGHNTIVAPATPRGQGAIAIVRLSGPEALAWALALTRRENLTPRYAHLCMLYNPSGEAIDQAIVLYFAPPKSYTGEALVEFQTHGGDAASTALIESLIALGARLAEPGEFSRRAILNGKMDAAQAEAAAALIAAKSTRAATLLARQLTGSLSQFVNGVRERLIRLRAHVEVSIDYAEEDLPKELKSRMFDQLKSLREQLQNTAESSRRRQGLLSGFRAAIIGKPNAGKSSLLNALVNYDRAIVSDQAGTTRDTIEEEVRVGGHLIRLIDTAGLRHTDDAVEKIGIDYSRRAASGADLIIALFDASRPLEAEDDAVLALLETLRADKSVLVALNKCDRARAIDAAAFAGFETVQISAKGDISPLLAHLETLLNAQSAGEETLLVSMRQIEIVSAAQVQIALAEGCLQRGDLELFGYHCAETIGLIGTLTRPFEYGELLDVMFGEFCLGK